MTPLALDAFDLLDVVGAGGMGTVWRARHRPTGAVVAIKTLDVRHFASPGSRIALESEAHAAAALDHPNIVAVFDRGRVTAADAEPSGGRLQPGAPWLAMEYVGGGTLGQALGRVTWERARALLGQLLDALAHAHARGLLHRDIKPENVLLDAVSGEARLTDFGLARRWLSPGLPGGAVGTPEYMAPELAIGAVLEQDESTDLYGVGCLAWALLTGRPPWVGLPGEVLQHQQEAPLPRFRPLIPVPRGLAPWMERTLAKDPTDRWASAADAFDALRALDGDDAPGPRPWRRSSGRVAPLRGGGLGVYGLRSVPMVGRERARDRLWSTLAAVADGTPRAVVVRGPAGVGKTRLARWLCERAEELGIARSLRATHGEQAGPADGLGPMVLRLARAEGEPRQLVRSQLERALKRGDTTALPSVVLDELTELASPLSAADRAAGLPAPRFRRSEERYLAIERLLSALATRRSVVVWLDDAHWGIDALAFVRFLMRPRSRPLPVLLLLTIRDEALAERLLESSLLDGILDEPHAEALPLGPLDAPDHQRLVRGLLGLEPSLAERVEARTAGNPLFAVHLVGDWVRRQLLTANETGLRLRDGVDVSLPGDLRSMWTDPLDELLGDRPAADRIALELGAALGQVVSAEEWAGVCFAAGLAPSDDLLAAAASRRLVLPRDTEWAWAHGMVRETVLSLSPDAAARHRTCAAWLGEHLPTLDHDRVGQHLLAAHRPAEAWTALMRSGRMADISGAQARARRAFQLAERALDEMDAADDDPRRLRWRYSLCVSQTAGGNLQVGIEMLSALVRDAEKADARGVLIYALDALARARSNHGDGDAAMELAERALALFEANPDLEPDRLPVILATASICAARARGPELELRYARRAVAASEVDGVDPYSYASAYLTLGTALLHARQYPEAARVLERTIEHSRRTGFISIEVRALNVLGEVHRAHGDLAAATRSYQRALALAMARRPVGTALVRANLALLHLCQDQLPEAESQATMAKALSVEQGNGAMIFFTNLMLLSVRAAAGDWARWDGLWAEVAPKLDRPMREKDIPLMLRLAAGKAVASPERARAALDAEQRYYEVHGRD